MRVQSREYKVMVDTAPCADLEAALSSNRGETDVALILWSKGRKGRMLTAEFSVRYEAEREAFPANVASGAKRFFEGLQHLDWTRPEAVTKTQHMYGGICGRGGAPD